jgi:hypothetical protein
MCPVICCLVMTGKRVDCESIWTYLCLHSVWRSITQVMAETCLQPLPSNVYLCLLNVTVNVLSPVYCSAHTLLSVTLNVLSLVHHKVLCRLSVQRILGLHVREEDNIHFFVSYNAYTESLIPPPLKMRPRYLAMMGGTHKYRKRLPERRWLKCGVWVQILL